MLTIILFSIYILRCAYFKNFSNTLHKQTKNNNKKLVEFIKRASNEFVKDVIIKKKYYHSLNPYLQGMASIGIK